MQRHTHTVRACLAVTRHLLFWQNDRDFLRATAVTRGATDTETRVTAKKVKILPPLLPGLEPATFPVRVRSLTTELSSLPFLFHYRISNGGKNSLSYV